MVSVVKTVKNTERLRQIVTVLVKHGFGELLARMNLGALLPGKRDDAPPRKTFAERLRQAAQELGPSFIKLGQIASTRSDLLPADIVAELSRLQDDVPPMSADDVAEVLADTFGGTEDELFTDFDPKPLASASIGQVHCATVRVDGEAHDVVVKIQRPRIRNTIERDLDLLYLLARLVEQYIPESRLYSPVGLVGEFDRAITAELDYTREADHAERFARNFEGDETVRFPRVYRHASGKRVLTMERFHGTKITEFCATHGCGEPVAKNALNAIAKMVFADGFFHADPHPGNIIMLGTADAPVIGLIDLGLVGRLSPELRDKLVQLVIAAVVSQADDALADALLAIGKPRQRVDTSAFRAEVSELSEKYLGKPVSEIEVSALIRDLVQGAIKYDIEMPVEMMMVGKALMTVEGIGKEIYPELDVFEELEPFMMKLLWERYSPKRLGRDLLRGISALRTSATSLPGQVSDILEDIRAGRLHIKTEDTEVARANDRLGRRVFAAIGSSALLVSATALLVADRHAGLAWTLLSLAATLLVIHVILDWRRGK